MYLNEIPYFSNKTPLNYLLFICDSSLNLYLHYGHSAAPLASASYRVAETHRDETRQGCLYYENTSLYLTTTFLQFQPPLPLLRINEACRRDHYISQMPSTNLQMTRTPTWISTYRSLTLLPLQLQVSLCQGGRITNPRKNEGQIAYH